MLRWLPVVLCGLVLGGLAYGQSGRAPDARPLGGSCLWDRECLLGLQCVEVDGVLAGQCSAACNTTGSCQQRFGQSALCIGADVCVRTCENADQCPGGTTCNAYGWCETPNASE